MAPFSLSTWQLISSNSLTGKVSLAEDRMALAIGCSELASTEAAILLKSSLSNIFICFFELHIEVLTPNRSSKLDPREQCR
jgi:hypothetical protein